MYRNSGFGKQFRRPNGQSAQIISHLNIDSSEIFDTQTWTPKQRCDQVPTGSGPTGIINCFGKSLEAQMVKVPKS